MPCQEPEDPVRKIEGRRAGVKDAIEGDLSCEAGRARPDAPTRKYRTLLVGGREGTTLTSQVPVGTLEMVLGCRLPS